MIFLVFFLKIAQSAQSGGRSEFAQFHAREEPLLYELNVKCHKYGTSLYSQRLVQNDRFYLISSGNQRGFYYCLMLFLPHRGNFSSVKQKWDMGHGIFDLRV